MENDAFGTNPLYENNFVYNETQQKILISNWLQLFKTGLVFDDPFQYGFRTFSQNNEDGILLYIFTLIGTTNKKVCEIGVNCWNSKTAVPESVSTNLISFHGWQGLLIDSDELNSGQILHHFHLNKNTTYYFFNKQKINANPDSSLFSPLVRQHFVSPENINGILSENNFSGEIDLLSIDIDSSDFFVFDAIDVCTPRVVILETDGGKIDYETSVVTKKGHPSTEAYMKSGFSGTMSLLAAVNLAKIKGYRLVTLSSGGWNAFFLRNDVGINEFPEISIEDAYKKIPAAYSFQERGETWDLERLNIEFPGLFLET